MTENLKGDLASLQPILEASYKPQREAESDLVKLGYKYDPELSSMDTKVFTDAQGNPHIAYRGTVRAETWLDNLLIGLGKKSKIDEEAIATAKKAQDKYGKAPTTYGHSRGGRSAEIAGEATGGKTYTYNKAVLPTDIFKSTRKEQTDIRTSKDVVSAPSYFQTGGEKVTIETGNDNWNPTVASLIKAHGLGELKSLPNTNKNGSSIQQRLNAFTNGTFGKSSFQFKPQD